MRAPRLLLSSLPLLVTGCGSSDLPSVTHGDFPPCGGPLTGTWNVAASSPMGDMQQSVCPGLTSDAKEVEFGGTMTFNANMTYTLSRTIGGTAKAMIPRTCLTAAAGAPAANHSCEQIGVFVTEALSMEGVPLSSFSCKTSGANCDCAMGFNPRAMTQTGTYLATGNTLALTYQQGTNMETERWDYCVDDKQLRMKPAPAAGGQLDLATTLSGVLVLKKP